MQALRSVYARAVFGAAFVGLVTLAHPTFGDSYSQWKARVFSQDEQADPNVSSELALSPAGDGIPNLLKYAFGWDPHQNGSLVLPQLSFVQITNSQTGQPEKVPAITYKVSSTDYPTDLYFVPEFSTDLKTWVRGDAVFASPTFQSPSNPGDPALITSRALSPVGENSTARIRLRVLEGQTLPEDWQIAGFGHAGVDPSADPDGDSRSNFEEFLHGTDPNDYFNGIVPELTIISGDGQHADPASLLPGALVVKVTHASQTLVNAPVRFSVPEDSGSFSLLPSGASSSDTLITRTDNAGLAAVYFRLPALPSVSIAMSISSGGASAVMSASTNAMETAHAGLSILSGNNQTGLTGHYLPDPFVVQLLDEHGLPVGGVPVVFSIPSEEGSLVGDRYSSLGANSISRVTDDEGLAWAYYLEGSEPGIVSAIDVTSQAPAAQNSFSVRSLATAPAMRSRVAAGERHTLACYADGTVWAWGHNSHGQLGDGTRNGRDDRGQVSNLTDAVSVSAFGATSVALRADGTVWAWGANDEGQLGNGTFRDSTVPVQVTVDGGNPLTGIVAIASGYSHNLALKNDGTVWAWGADWGFQLGNDSETDTPYALQVRMPDGTPLADVIAIACGDSHSLVVRVDGTAWAWGYNDEGEILGSGVTDWRSAVPAPVIGLTDVVGLAAGESHSLALRSDGVVWAWGKNQSGQLGSRLASQKSEAVAAVGRLEHIISIAAGRNHSLALRSDGNVWSWGENSNLTGIAPYKTASPIQIQGFGNNVINIAAGADQSFAVTPGGSIFGWGKNGLGQLGTHDADFQSIPTSVTDFILVDDPDHDGLATWKELKLGGNPNAYSTAGDGISDGWKARYGLSLTDASLAMSDPTGKGLTVLQDYQLGTDPTKLSTVGDGISDGWKFQNGFDLFDPTFAQQRVNRSMTVLMYYQKLTAVPGHSTVGDGIPDEWKKFYQLDVNDPDLANKDDDHDGLTTRQEYIASTDPTLPDTDDDHVPDGEDGWPNEKSLSPPRVPEIPCAVIDLGVDKAGWIDDDGQIVVTASDGSETFWITGQPVPSPTPEAFFERVSPSQENFHSANGTVTALQTQTHFVAFDAQGDQLWQSETYAANSQERVIATGTTSHHFSRETLVGPASALSPLAPVSADYQIPAYIATAIADDGTLAGCTQVLKSPGGDSRITYYPPKGLMIRAGAVTELGTLPGFDYSSVPALITVRRGAYFILGQSGGGEYTNALEHTFLWHSALTQDVQVHESKMIDLSALPGLPADVYGMAANKLDLEGECLYHIEGTTFFQYIPTTWRNGRFIDPNTLLADASSCHLEGADFNDQGMGAGTATFPDGQSHGVVLAQAEMMVDGNRDGEMSFTDASVHDQDGTTKEKPYRFWLNNDHDVKQVVDGTDTDWDDASDGVKDCSYTIIDNERDLEDFTRLRVNFKGLTDLIKNTNHTVCLEWRSVDGTAALPASDGTPAINVYQEKQPDVRALYLEDETVASNQRRTENGISYNQWIGHVETGAPMDLFSIRPALRTALSEANPVINLLFCGKTAGRGQLVLTVKKGSELVAQLPPIYIELLDIKDMYERWTVGDGKGGAPENLAPSLRAMPIGYASPGHSRPFAYSAGDSEESKYILFVHGWNVSPDEKEQFAETAYKRLFWQGYKGRFGIFEWPTTYGFDPEKNKLDPLTDPTNYDRGEWSAWRSALSLRSLLVAKNQACPGQVYVLAHSMGNVVVGEALRLQSQSGTEQIVNTYVASQAALPAQCYDGTIAQDQPLGTNLQWTYDHPAVPGPAYPYGPATPNIYRNWLAFNGTAVGRRVSFRNLNDYALTPEVWQFNQITKPDWRDMPNQPWDYHYDGDPEQPPLPTGFWKSRGDGTEADEHALLQLGDRTDVKDRYEIMSFDAEPRSQALGGSSPVNGFAEFDIQSLWPPDDSPTELQRFGNYSAHKWHSAEFRSTNMRQKDYWKALLGNAGFKIKISTP